VNEVFGGGCLGWVRSCSEGKRLDGGIGVFFCVQVLVLALLVLRQ